MEYSINERLFKGTERFRVRYDEGLNFGNPLQIKLTLH